MLQDVKQQADMDLDIPQTPVTPPSTSGDTVTSVTSPPIMSEGVGSGGHGDGWNGAGKGEGVKKGGWGAGAQKLKETSRLLMMRSSRYAGVFGLVSSKARQHLVCGSIERVCYVVQ